MAEIHVERRRPIWPWIVGALALLLIVVGVAWLRTEPARTDAGPAEDPAGPGTGIDSGARGYAVGTSGALPAAIREYVEFSESPTGSSPGREHEYIAEGLRRLTAGLETLVEEPAAADGETRERLERFRRSANRLQQDPTSLEHSQMVRDVFTSAVDLLASPAIQAGNVNDLSELADSIDPGRPLLEQTEPVERFFRESAQALERAARS